MMSYSQYRQRNGSGNGKLPAISSAISGKKSPVASEDEEHLTQEGSFTGSSSRINPYNRQPFSSAKRKSKMGRLKTAPVSPLPNLSIIYNPFIEIYHAVLTQL